jgi:hypothetical protein
MGDNDLYICVQTAAPPAVMCHMISLTPSQYHLDYRLVIL